ncbi:hypothetical protein GCM10027430_14900 [Lysobacter tyrosinilyticus]
MASGHYKASQMGRSVAVSAAMRLTSVGHCGVRDDYWFNPNPTNRELGEGKPSSIVENRAFDARVPGSRLCSSRGTVVFAGFGFPGAAFSRIFNN